MKGESFSQNLLGWYDVHKRNLPWRGSLDPYTIWLSEIILQQTRVEQGLPYFERFQSLFPDVHALANATEDEVMKAWEGLGYYSRARNLHKAAKYVSIDCKGQFPPNYVGLLALPGVGPYTAAAISSICYSEAVPVIDGNVNRVMSRLIGLNEPVDTSAGRAAILKELEPAIEQVKSPGDFNQAVMEFGARYCTPRSPDCSNCIFTNDCIAHTKDLVSMLPIKKGKTKVSKKYFDYHVLIHDGHVYLHKRTRPGIWQGLYEFLLEEHASPVSATNSWVDGKEVSPSLVLSYTHLLSHQRISARFLVYRISDPVIQPEYERVAIGDLHQYPMARISTRFLEESGSSIFAEGH